MKNVLIDKQVSYLEQDEFQDLFKEYCKKYVVGKDVKETSFDENCANFCIERSCDFITADKEAYHHFFKIRQVKSIEISQFLKREPRIDRPVYCMRIKLEYRNKIKIINKEQMKLLQMKTRGNVDRLLEFLYQVIGYPEDKKYVLTTPHIYECYAIFTHAVEEYGKLLYLESLKPEEGEKYKIDYSKKFTDHKTKFELALAKLPSSIKIVYEGNFSSDYGASSFDTDVEATWENRLNVLNTDIDNDGNPTDIQFGVDIDKLRECVFDFRNFL